MKHSFHKEDEHLLILFQDKETKEKAFSAIVEKYKERLYWHIRKIVLSHYDTDDVLQNTFIKVWNKLYTFRQEAKLFSWLYRIATNEALTFLKNKRIKSFEIDGETKDILLENLESSAYLDGDAIKIELQKAILKLPDKQRLVFNMKYFDNLKYEEISEMLETSIGALKASYHHAVKKIEKYLNLQEI